MKKALKISLIKITKLSVAGLLMIIGLVGLVLPILNGVFFILAALIIISLEVPVFEEWLDRQSLKHKKVHLVYGVMKKTIKKYF